MTSNHSEYISMFEFKLHDAPDDIISAVKFGLYSNKYLLVSSWDCTVRLYDVTENNMTHLYSNKLPVLDVCFNDSVHSFSGGLDSTLTEYDFKAESKSIIGQHDGPIRCIEFASDVNCVITGSWDGTVKIWDPRISQCVGSYSQSDKVYAMNVLGETLVVGAGGRKVLIWDLRNMSIPQRHESMLRYQTRALKCSTNKLAYVISSVEGRVAIDYMGPNPNAREKTFAFKCHRVKAGGVEHVFPVNSISFHTGYNTFATGGSDGFVNIWDGFNKKRLCQYHEYETSISSVSFSPDNSLLAIGCSYLNELETPPDPIPNPSIFVRLIQEEEVKPKIKT